MEKEKPMLFFEVPYQKILQQLTNVIKAKAMEHEEFRESKNGAIRVCIVPLSPIAELWLGGGLSKFNILSEGEIVNDICEREFVFKLHPNGSHTMSFICDDEHIEPVDCYGYTALKVAFASRKRNLNEWIQERKVTEEMLQKETQYCIPENGYTADPGVAHTTVTINGEPFIRLYIAISGFQDGTDDLTCVKVGMELLEKIVNDPSIASQ